MITNGDRFHGVGVDANGCARIIANDVVENDGLGSDNVDHTGVGRSVIVAIRCAHYGVAGAFRSFER